MGVVDDIITLLQNNWNITPVPTIARITLVTRANYQDTDYILAYEYDWNQRKKGFEYNFIRRSVVLSLDIRTKNGYQNLKLLEEEMRRILHANRKNPVTNFDKLNIIRKTDQSNESVLLYRVVIDIELINLTEAL